MANLQQLIERRKAFHEKKSAQAKEIADIKKFLSKVNKIKRGCWEWTGPLFENGYGQFYFDGRTQRAHRFSYLHYIGPIEDGMYVCHKCDNPKCVNPAHLFQGTASQNMQDCVSKGRHPNFFTKGRIAENRSIDEDTAASIKSYTSNETGLTLQGIADLFNVPIQLVKDIKYGRSYYNV